MRSSSTRTARFALLHKSQMVMTGVNLCPSWWAFSALGNFRPLGFLQKRVGFPASARLFILLHWAAIYLLCTVQDKFLGGDGYDPHYARFLQSVYDDDEKDLEA